MISNILKAFGFEHKLDRTRPTELATTWSTWKQQDEDPIASTLQSHVRYGFSGNSIVYACLAEKSLAAAFARVRVYKGTQNSLVELNDNFADLFKRPNEDFSWVEFQQLLNLYLDLDGNAFIYKHRENPNSQEIDKLMLLRPDKVVSVIKDGVTLGYLYKSDPNRDPEPFLKNEIIHIKYPNPNDPNNGLGRGISPLNSVLSVVQLDNQNTSFLNTFFKNAAVPFGLLKSKQRLNDPEISRIRDRIRKQYAGSFNWHEVMILDADAEYQRLGLNLKELEFSALDFRNEARICSVLRVPPQIVGARVGLENNTYSNYEEARKSFWEDKLVPYYVLLQSALNKGFYEDFGGDVFLEYDFSEVPALKAQQNALFERAITGLQSGLFTLSEAREIVGYESMEENDDEASVKQLKYSAINFNRKAKEIVLETQDNLESRIAIEEKQSAYISTALRKQKKKILELFKKENVSVEEGISAWKETESFLFDACQKMLIASVLFGARFGLDTIEEFLGVNEKELLKPEIIQKQFTVGTWDLINEQALSWAQSYTFELVSGLNATSEGVLRTALSTWIQNGLNITELDKSLSTVFGTRRAKAIARTEVTRAYAEGNVIAFRESGVVTGIQIRNPQDEKTCPQCGPLAGLTFDKNGNLNAATVEQQQNRAITSDLDNVSFAHPGGNHGAAKYEGESFTAPPIHVNCRCWIVPVVS